MQYELTFGLALSATRLTVLASGTPSDTSSFPSELVVGVVVCGSFAGGLVG